MTKKQIILSKVTSIEEELLQLKELLKDLDILEQTEQPKQTEFSENEDIVIGNKLLSELPKFYEGRCGLLKLHKRYFDNGQPKLFIDKYHIVIEAFDSEMNQIGSYCVRWKNLQKYHSILIRRGINKHSKEDWFPYNVLFDLDD